SIEGALQTPERRVAGTSEPRFAREVVDRDKAPDTILVRDLPVIAATAHGRVLRRAHIEIPALAESIEDRALVEALGQRPHATDAIAPRGTGRPPCTRCRSGGPPS